MISIQFSLLHLIVVVSRKLIHGVFYLDHFERSGTTINGVVNLVAACNTVCIPQSALWHFRLGHAPITLIQKLKIQVPSIDYNKTGVCDMSQFAKQRRATFSPSFSNASRPLALIHMDIWGPYSTTSVHGHRYFLTIVDDYSRFTWLILLKGKYEVQQAVQDFVLMIENQLEKKVQKIRSDNGPKFSLPKFYASKGIIHQKSCVSTPQQNARVERKHQHILNVARGLLFPRKLA